jgi:hypothetical protein
MDLTGTGRASVLLDEVCPGTCADGAGIDLTLLRPDGSVDWYRRR